MSDITKRSNIFLKMNIFLRQFHQCQAVGIPLSVLKHTLSSSPEVCYHPFTITSGVRLSQNDPTIPPQWHPYVADLLEIFSFLPPHYMVEPFLIRFGDCIASASYPVLSKARQIGDQNAVLLPLNDERHFGEWFETTVYQELALDFPFWDKFPKAFWRGSSTDVGWDPAVCQLGNSRRVLVERWGLSSDPRIDVGLFQLVQEAKDIPEFREHWQRYVRPLKPIHDQIVHRYLISVEGNDVASGLKWMLASQSVVMMPPPKREIWIRESYLEPWVHYIPLKEDTSDIIEKMEWCEKHLFECHAITIRANAFVRTHANRTQRLVNGAKQLKNYLDNVSKALFK